MDKLNNLLSNNELDSSFSTLPLSSGLSSETAFDDRPLSPVLNKSTLHRKAPHRRRSGRRNKVQLPNSQDDKHKNTSLEIENELITSPHLSAEERITKLRQLEETKREYSDFLHNTSVENPNCGLLVAEHNFKKPVSPAPNKKRGKRTYCSLESKSKVSQTSSSDKIQNNSQLYEGILSNEELDKTKSSFASFYKDEQSDEKISNDTMSRFLETSISDMQLNLLTDVAYSSLCDNSLTDAKNGDEDFKGFKSSLYEKNLVAAYNVFIEYIKETGRLTWPTEPPVSKKRKLSSSNENLDKKMKCDSAVKNYHMFIESKEFTTAGGDCIQVSNETLQKANVFFESTPCAFEEKFVTKDLDSEIAILFPQSTTTDANNMQISNGTFKQAIPVLENLPLVAVEESSFKSIQGTSMNTNPVFTGFNTAGGKTIQISNDSLTRANQVLGNLPPIDEESFKSEVKDTEPDILIPSSGFSATGEQSIPILNGALNNLSSSFKNSNSDSKVTSSVLGGRTKRVSHDSLSRPNLALQNLPCALAEKLEFESKTKGSELPFMSTGFKTAAGTSIQISNDALKKANRVLEKLPGLPQKELAFNDSNSDFKLSPRTGLDTTGERDEQVSKDGLTKANLALDNLLCHSKDKLEFENKGIGSKIPFTPTGFKTAAGTDIQISTVALKKANRVLEKLPVLPQEKSAFNDSNSGFKTGHHITGRRDEEVSKDGLEKADLPLDNLLCSSKDKLEFESKTKGSKISFAPTGFKTAAGTNIQISNEALKKANRVLEKLPVLPQKELVLNDSNNDFKISPTGLNTTQHISKNTLTKANLAVHTLLCPPEDKLQLESTCKGLKIPFTPTGFKTAAGTSIQMSNEALKKANRVLAKLPALPLRKSSFNNGNSDLEVANSTAELDRPVKTIQISNDSLTKPTQLLNNLPICNNLDNVIATPTVGFGTACGKNIAISDNALMKANKILMESNSVSLNTFEDNSIICENLLPLVINFEEISDEAWDKTGNDFEKTSKDPGFNLASNPADHLIENIDLNKPKIDNSIDNKEYRRNKENKSIGSCHKKFVSPLNRTKTVTPKRTLGVSINKQLIVSKESLQRASKLFDEENFSTNTLYSSTPVKDTSAFQQGNLNNERSNRTTLFSNTNITPIKCLKVKDVVEENQLLTTCDDYDDPILIRNQNTKLNCVQSVESQLEIIRIRMQALESQKQLLESANFVHNYPKPGVLLSKKRSFPKMTWNNFLENRKPGCISISEALNFKVSKSVLIINPSNAKFINFNCNWNAKEQQVVVGTQDGAVVIPNLNNLIGLNEISEAFKIMPSVDPTLIPEGWISNHFKWIVWKLASLERNFPNKFAGVLCIEILIQQLKYRYDREIDNAERPAIRKIMEKDDVPQKRLVLCVVDIIQTAYDMFELELTDGWYSIRTIIDRPLSNQVKNGKIAIGAKLITQGAELLHCDGCHPLQASNLVRLKITYNCTRRATWDLKLGYYKFPKPFPIYLKTVLPEGGLIGCLKVYIARVYPMKYIEKEVSGRTIWRNKKAEDKRAQEWESERSKMIDLVQEKLQKEFEIETNEVVKTKLPTHNSLEISKINSPEVLYQMLESTNDPEGLRSTLSSAQLFSAMNYKINYSLKRQQELSSRMTKELKTLKLASRNVTPVLTLRVSDALDLKASKVAHNFSIYQPTEEHIQLLTEGSTFFIYNVLPKQSGELASNSRTHFELESTNVANIAMQRCIVPISQIAQLEKPILNEYDTYGTIVRVDKSDPQARTMWLTDFSERLLHIKVVESTERCCLLDNLSRGHAVALMNLIFCSYKNNFAQAVAYQGTVITSYPQHKLLQDKFDDYCKRLPKDLSSILFEYDAKVENCLSASTLKGSRDSSCLSNMEFSHRSNISDFFDESFDDSTIIPSRLTTTDIAMSLIDTDQFFENL